MQEFDINKLLTKDKKTIEDGGHKKKQIGRPKVDIKKTKNVTTYLTDDDYEQLKEEADKRGMSVSSYAASIILLTLRS